MKNILLLLALLLPVSLIAQNENSGKDKKSKENMGPRVVICSVNGESVQPVTSVEKGKENRIRVTLEGGMEKVSHQMFVTSKNATVIPSQSDKNEYLIVPLKDEEWVEIIVDVKTFEKFFAKVPDASGKKKLKEFPPKTYMVGYEKVPVR